MDTLVPRPGTAPYAPPATWRSDRNPSHGNAALLPIWGATRVLPRRVAQGLAWVLGTGMAHTFRRTRRVLAGNLARLGRGRWTDREIQRLVTAVIRNWGRCVVDSMYLARATPATLPRLVGRLDGGAILDAAVARGRGVVLITPHLGHWELGGALLAQAGYRVHVVTGVVAAEAVRNLKVDFRARLGIKQLTVEPGSPRAMLGILDALRAGEIVAMLPDRDSGAEHVTVEFCGDRARMPIGPAFLAVRTGATLLPAYVVRGPDGRYDAAIEPPIEVPEAAPHERAEAVRAVTQRVATCLEGIIERHPDQWYQFFPAWEPRAA